MAGKENKGGLLSNEQIEKDLETRGKNAAPVGYQGSQDTGDTGKRELGTPVQQQDGGAPDEVQDLNES
ncbi:MAG: hypothetical protein JWP88_2119 [Flaviaesturariibacter sp.]|nr:hypothetical protein [Flaviaesturariibacter sp.]